MSEIRVGDKVRNGVYVLGEWVPMEDGIVKEITPEGHYMVDVMSHRGGAPWVKRLGYNDIRKEARDE